MIPAAAVALIPVLCAQLAAYWPGVPAPQTFAAQAQQESRWNPRAVLQTSREYGFGIYQLTKTPTFNNFNVVVRMNPLLATWAWADRWDPAKQMLGGLTLDKQAYGICLPLMSGTTSVLACMLASFNGGIGGFRSDRRLCSNTKGCDPRTWFGNVENTSLKSKVAAAGYGASFFAINRAYPRTILLTSGPQYVSAMQCPAVPHTGAVK